MRRALTRPRECWHGYAPGSLFFRVEYGNWAVALTPYLPACEYEELKQEDLGAWMVYYGYFSY